MKTHPYLDLFSTQALPAPLRKDAALKAMRLVGALREVGLDAAGGFSLSDYATYAHDNEDKMTLSPVFDGRYHESGEDRTMIVYATKDGRPVASCGLRLIWMPCTLADSMERLDFWYGDAGTSRSNESCEVTAPVAQRIEHVYIAWTGATTNFSGFRGATTAVVRLAYLYAAANWRWTMLAAIAEPHIAYVEDRERPYSRAHDIYGFASAESEVRRGKARFLLMTSPRGYVESFVRRGDFGMLEVGAARAKLDA
jgi:hypothetical protein